MINHEEERSRDCLDDGRIRCRRQRYRKGVGIVRNGVQWNSFLFLGSGGKVGTSLEFPREIV